MFDGKAKIIRCQILPIPLHPQHAGQIDTDEQQYNVQAQTNCSTANTFSWSPGCQCVYFFETKKTLINLVPRVVRVLPMVMKDARLPAEPKAGNPFSTSTTGSGLR